MLAYGIKSVAGFMSPTVFEINGAKVYMYFEDHDPPHVHVRIAGKESVLEIQTGRLVAGSIDRLTLSLVRKTIAEHRLALLSMWESRNEPGAIKRLD